MDNLSALFKAFYSRFVLRDLLAKITPGIIVSTAAFLTFPDPFRILPSLDSLPLSFWILVFGLSWTVGISVQGLRSKLKYNVNAGVEPKDWRRMYFSCHRELERLDSEALKLEFERMAVVLEVSGNSATALSLSIIIVGLGRLIHLHLQFCRWLQDEVVMWLPTILLALLSIIGLLILHSEAVKALYQFMQDHQFQQQPNGTNPSAGNGT